MQHRSTRGDREEATVWRRHEARRGGRPRRSQRKAADDSRDLRAHTLPRLTPFTFTRARPLWGLGDAHKPLFVLPRHLVPCEKKTRATRDGQANARKRAFSALLFWDTCLATPGTLRRGIDVGMSALFVGVRAAMRA